MGISQKMICQVFHAPLTIKGHPGAPLDLGGGGAGLQIEFQTHWQIQADLFKILFYLLQLFLPKVTVMYILGVFAFTFYLTKFPERFFPGM